MSSVLNSLAESFDFRGFFSLFRNSKVSDITSYRQRDCCGKAGLSLTWKGPLNTRNA